MGYLSNSGTITVDAILTKKGRELLAKGQGAFNITQFALSDDEVDYDLWNPLHGLGTNYYGVVIENMPVTEAVPDETQSMKYKLITLPVGTKSIPYLQTSDNATSYSFQSAARQGKDNGTLNITFSTYKYENLPQDNRLTETGMTYSVTILDTTYMDLINVPSGVIASPSGNSKKYTGILPGGGINALDANITIQGKIFANSDAQTKTTKIILENEIYGSRLVIPISYTF
jgi:hypothetical protein